MHGCNKFPSKRICHCGLIVNKNIIRRSRIELLTYWSMSLFCSVKYFLVNNSIVTVSDTFLFPVAACEYAETLPVVQWEQASLARLLEAEGSSYMASNSSSTASTGCILLASRLATNTSKTHLGFLSK